MCNVYKKYGELSHQIFVLLYIFPPKSHFGLLFNWDKTKTKHPLPMQHLFWQGNRDAENKAFTYGVL